MRAIVVGLFGAALGVLAVWRGAAEGAWLFAAGGVVLTVAGVFYMVRPGRRSMGLLEVCWGTLIIGHYVRTQQAISFDTPRASGRAVGLVLGGILIVVGIWNLLKQQTAPPASAAARDHASGPGE